MRVRSANATLVVTTRKPEQGRKQFITLTIEGVDVASHSSGLHRITGVLPTPMAITPVPDAVSSSSEIVRFDSLESFTYP